ncbi:FecR family protein [Pseudoflavitalea rhizosphaerae]|uniref:FecR family protein n=1 Tax=Pseudoflavitalea rhizosphaerae TaxID=1884793 RepID=UPI000F8EC6A3|nr:FecR family protein [Pseudoflavitalea rhizosphaerae]
MNNTRQRLKALLQKQLDASISAAEQQELFALSNDPALAPLFQELFDEVWHDLEASRPQSAMERPLVKQNWFRIAAAAAVVAAVLGTWFWLSTSEKSTGQKPATFAAKDIPPGKDGAILTLADGKQIMLDTVKNGSILQLNGISMEVKNGQLMYPQRNNGSIAWHTMSTPKGRQFQLQLPDGSQVWLNAASSIRYPSTFSGNERKVEIDGEAYLEIAIDKNKPFIVITRKQKVEVIGTSFNINAYSDELNERTTLLEGSVKVKHNHSSSSSLLQPGRQAQVDENTVTVRDADVDEAIAWKNGLFHFVNADIPTVMRQLQRWYNIEVSYEGAIPKREFQGKMQRDLNLSELISLLEKADLHIKLEGERKLVITP